MENNLENDKKSAGLGFDTAENISTKGQISPSAEKSKNTLLLIGAGILIAGVIYIFAGSVFSPVRNCIKSISGVPECSDCTAKLMKTTLNGRSLGECSANPGTGKYEDQCTLSCSN